ncbi:MAG: MBL fold metallo-hydrolase [Chloroflexi bacterium]|nr:MBL fold metallo-hydrolase [Chloroflexota bacterium]
MMPEQVDGMQGIWLVDTAMYGVPRLSSVYLVEGERLAVIDSGDMASWQSVHGAIQEMGRQDADVSFIIVTHIHLDHAGGAAKLLRRMPQARLAVHERGARHMIDPSRLMASVRRSMVGAKESEEMEPAPENRVLAVRDGDVLDLGGRRLRILGSPGHAPHEICIFDEKDRAAFTGDALGLYLEGGRVVLPNAVMPDFDLASGLESIERLRALAPGTLLFAHFGAALDAPGTTDKVVGVMKQWEDAAMSVAQGAGIEEVAPELRRYGFQQIEGLRPNQALHEHIGRVMVPMIAAAYEKHCKRKMGMI